MKITPLSNVMRAELAGVCVTNAWDGECLRLPASDITPPYHAKRPSSTIPRIVYERVHRWFTPLS